MSQMPLHRKGEENYDNLDAWQGDVLGRKEVADKLTRLIGGLRSSFVLSLEGTYGEGKTFFLRHWQKDLQQQGFITAYFNSWESDHLDDPFLPFMSAVAKAIDDKKLEGVEGETKAFLETAKDFSRKVVVGGGPLLAKGLMRYLLGDSGLEELRDLADKTTENDMAKAVGNAVGSALSKQLEEQQSLKKFRDSLKETIRELTENFDDEQRKIIVLVDELDRCKPTYAVKVLERIKHFFEVDGLVFVLGINERQVANSMTAVYGAKLDTEEYLRRFIHWRFKLPTPSAIDYAKLLAKKFKLDELDALSCDATSGMADWRYRNLDVFIEHFGVFSEALGLTLRQQEQAFTAANLYLRTLRTAEKPFAPVLGALTPMWLVRDNAYLGSNKIEKMISSVIKSNPPNGSAVQYEKPENLESNLSIKLHPILEGRNYGTWDNLLHFKAAFISWFLSARSFSKLREQHVVRVGRFSNLTAEERFLEYRLKELRAIYFQEVEEAPSAAQSIWERLEQYNMLLLNNDVEEAVS